MLFYQVQVYQPRTAVGKNLPNQFSNQDILVLITRKPETHGYIFRIWAYHFGYNGGGNGLFGLKRVFGYRLGLHVPKSGFHFFNHFIGIKIAAHNNPHIVGYIVGIKVLPDLRKRRILQVFNGANGGLLSVVMVLEQFAKKLFKHLAAIIIQAAVFLLVNRFKLGMKNT